MLVRILLTLLVVVIWLVVFCLGAFIDTNPLREGIQENFNLANFFLILLAWIPTNIAFLSILAGLMGALSRGLLRKAEEELGPDEPEKQKGTALGGSIAGFMFYMAFMAGAFVMMDQPFTNTTETQYYRIAGSISFISFIAGFRPDTLRRILDRIPGF
jgi:Na+-transporting methylmalonyl-CoA/oxaloacetate decarboxylase gamma subunit